MTFAEVYNDLTDAGLKGYEAVEVSLDILMSGSWNEMSNYSRTLLFRKAMNKL